MTNILRSQHTSTNINQNTNKHSTVTVRIIYQPTHPHPDQILKSLVWKLASRWHRSNRFTPGIASIPFSVDFCRQRVPPWWYPCMIGSNSPLDSHHCPCYAYTVYENSPGPWVCNPCTNATPHQASVLIHCYYLCPTPSDPSCSVMPTLTLWQSGPMPSNS